MRRRNRGFTLVEMLIVSAVLAIIVIGAISFFGAPGGVMDLREEAKSWGREMGYDIRGASCSNVDSDMDGYVSCAVRVAEQTEPIALECHMVTKQCRPMKIRVGDF